ncbi:MAG: methyltransferase domain-containing protein [Syntrophobacteraceae bacterium]|nr:methyltransferase domain-containing protein [Syntrophobacteraceae bacterium]
MAENRFKEMYKSGITPWDIGKPDCNLVEVLARQLVSGCKAIDIGCGTGDNSLWLAQNGFLVTGVDTSEIALENARQKALDAKVACRFILADFLDDKIEGAPFGFAFDRGCLHSFSSEGDRKRFAQNVAVHLEKAGLWLTLVGNADEERKCPGPPRRSAGDIITAVEPLFEVLSLESSHFGSNHPNPPWAWRCLLRKRLVR